MTKYYQKYLKYKTKYLKLKFQKGGNDDYISELQKLYPECIHDKTILKDAEKYSKSGYATTYGEMDYQAIEKYNKLFNSDNKIDYFIDFGSGRGKLPLYMADTVNKKSIGIELVTERHDDAIKIKKTLSESYPDITNKVELINDDMFKYLEKINKDTFETPVLIWISNLCFGDEITEKLFSELIKKMPSNSIIGSSKIPSKIPDGIDAVKLESDSNLISVPMSWSKTSNIHIYKIK